jgi:hypothetical protein
MNHKHLKPSDTFDPEIYENSASSQAFNDFSEEMHNIVYDLDTCISSLNNIISLDHGICFKTRDELVSVKKSLQKIKHKL